MGEARGHASSWCAAAWPLPFAGLFFPRGGIEFVFRSIRSPARRVNPSIFWAAPGRSAHDDGDARQAERVFGWNRKTVDKGLIEQAFGVEFVTPPDARGRPRSEDRDARLGQAIDAEMEDHAQTDPKFQTAWSYTRATAANVRQETAARWNENAASLIARN